MCSYADLCVSQGQTANIYIDSKYIFRVAHDYGMFQKQYGFPTSRGNEIKIGPYVQELLNVILLSALSKSITLLNTSIKILGHSKLNFLEMRGNHLAAISAPRAISLKETYSSQISIMEQTDSLLNDNLEKLAQ